MVEEVIFSLVAVQLINKNKLINKMPSPTNTVKNNCYMNHDLSQKIKIRMELAFRFKILYRFQCTRTLENGKVL